MSVTTETSQSPIGPFELLTQSPTGDNEIHAKNAAFNSSLLPGLNTAVEGMLSAKITVSVGKMVGDKERG